MPKQRSSHRAYRAIVRLYPKAHREQYGALMVQTFDDMVAGQEGQESTAGIWWRIAKELPLNLIEEHSNNLRGMDMGKTVTSKKFIIGAGIIVVSAVAIVAAIALRGGDYSPTTLANVQKSKPKTACAQPTANTTITVPKDQEDFVGNAVASSIIDVPAGTNVDVFFKTYSTNGASGTAVYSGSFGSYNFVAQKAPGSNDSFTGGWKITQFSACK